MTADALPSALDDQALAALLSAHPCWRHEGITLTRSLTFADFRRAMAFMVEVGFVADRLNHHPEWSNVYNRVDIVMTTHDIDGLSALDADMVAAIDGIAAALGGH